MAELEYLYNTLHLLHISGTLVLLSTARSTLPTTEEPVSRFYTISLYLLQFESVHIMLKYYVQTSSVF